MKRGLLAASLVATAIGAMGACRTEALSPGPLAPIDPVALMSTLTDLAALGDKRVGTPADAMAGDYVIERMRKMKLTDVHQEAFDFPRYDLVSSTFAITLDAAADSAAESPGYDVLEASGSGHADADVVPVGTAQPSEIADEDLHGKIALIDQNPLYPRATQLANVARAGAAAVVFISTAPDNLRQIGSVRHGWEAFAAIPAIAIGAADGAAIKAAAKAGKRLHATIDVKATRTPAAGRNIVGSIEGQDPSAGAIVVGAHYDTWFTGSSDNGGGVAALLALAERRFLHERPIPTVYFVAYDGDEVALFGGYDFLRKHRIAAKMPITLVFNVDIPSSTEPMQAALWHSNIANLEGALRQATLPDLYPSFGNMGTVPPLFGGAIPADIQGIYRNGVPSVTTHVQGPYAHTTADTPDKVDVPFLADAVDRFDQALTALISQGPACCSTVDPEIWKATVVLRPRAAGAPLFIDATVTDGTGVPQANAVAEASLLVDDFSQAALVHGTTDASGKVTFEVPGPAADMITTGTSYVHVTAGQTYPLVEQIVAILP